VGKAYYLGVDVGTTYTAAAVWRDGRVEVATLGLHSPVIPTVVFAGDAGGAGSLLIGDVARRRGATEPQGIAREFKRRIGDPTPIILKGVPYTAEALMAQVLRSVLDSVSAQQGGPPGGIVVSHPANWGGYKKDLLLEAVDDAGVGSVTTVTEPEAAAIHYASQERVDNGTVVAVYDLGGGTFDVALLRKVAKGWEIVGKPEGIERLGGIDFDEAVFRHVAAATEKAFDALDEDDPRAITAVARLRRECVEAKEALSSDSLVSIPVLLPPAFQADVRLTRAEFEEMIRLPLLGSVEALRRAVRSAEIEVDAIDRVLLVGGSSRIPLVASLVASELGRPVAVDAHPKYSVALGAAILAAEASTSEALLTREVIVPPEIAAAELLPDLALDLPAAAADDAGAGPNTQPVPPPFAPVVPSGPVFPQLVLDPILEEAPAPAPADADASASASLPTQESAAARPAPPAPAPPPAEPPSRSRSRQVYVPAPEVASPGPITPPQPQTVVPSQPRPQRPVSGGRPAVEAAKKRRRRKRRAYALVRWFSFLVVLASMTVVGLLVIHSQDPELFDRVVDRLRDLQP